MSQDRELASMMGLLIELIFEILATFFGFVTVMAIVGGIGGFVLFGAPGAFGGVIAGIAVGLLLEGAMSRGGSRAKVARQRGWLMTIAIVGMIAVVLVFAWRISR
jgi:hypothetical protein